VNSVQRCETTLPCADAMHPAANFQGNWAAVAEIEATREAARAENLKRAQPPEPECPTVINLGSLRSDVIVNWTCFDLAVLVPGPGVQWDRCVYCTTTSIKAVAREF